MPNSGENVRNILKDINVCIKDINVWLTIIKN